jgi:hypothetical protein
VGWCMCEGKCAVDVLKLSRRNKKKSVNLTCFPFRKFEMEVEPTFELVNGVLVVLCSVESARAMFLDCDDPFLESLNEFEITARRGALCSLEEFMEYQASNALAWPVDTFASFEPTLLEIGKMLARFPVFVKNLPKRIRFILSTGCEEAREPRKVAYCRGSDVVVISAANLKSWKKPEKMKRLLLHELWHIFSRNASLDLADRCYSVFGFKRVPKKRGAPYPDEIALLQFTNPDGMTASHFIDVASDEGHVLPLVPLVFLTPYDVAQEGASPFDFLTVVFGVLRMEEDEESGKIECSWVTEDVEEGQDEIDQDMTLLVPPQMVPANFWTQVHKSRELVFVF